MNTGGPPMDRQQLHHTFRPVRSRRVAWGVAAALLVVLTVVALAAPASGGLAFEWYDRLGIIAVGALGAWILSRFARIEAVPREDGLRVRNLFVTTDLEWAQVVSVRFGGGGPWVTLDLSDGDTLAVMAIQRADGESGIAEAGRLATLVALHSATSRDD